MSILAIVGVIVSSAAMFVVLSGFSGLKNYSLEFFDYPKKLRTWSNELRPAKTHIHAINFSTIKKKK